MKLKLAYSILCCVLAGICAIAGFEISSLRDQLAESAYRATALEAQVAAQLERAAYWLQRYQDEARKPEPPAFALHYVTVETKSEPVTKEVIVYPQDFASLTELEAFVAGVGIVVSIGDGACYDAARYYKKKALEQGKTLNIETALAAEYNFWFTKKRLEPGATFLSGEGHAFLNTVINREIFWIEPETMEIIWRGTMLSGER